MNNLIIINTKSTQQPIDGNVIYMADEAKRLRGLVRHVIVDESTVPTSRAHIDYNLSIYAEVMNDDKH